MREPLPIPRYAKVNPAALPAGDSVYLRLISFPAGVPYAVEAPANSFTPTFPPYTGRDPPATGYGESLLEHCSRVQWARCSIGIGGLAVDLIDA